MIGDLILVADGEQMNVRKIQSITRKKIGYHKTNGETRMWHAPLYSVKPIPLTPEILKANGFVDRRRTGVLRLPDQLCERHLTYYLKDNMLCVGLPYADKDCNMIHRISYVHKLQHALRIVELHDIADNFIV